MLDCSLTCRIKKSSTKNISKSNTEWPNLKKVTPGTEEKTKTTLHLSVWKRLQSHWLLASKLWDFRKLQQEQEPISTNWVNMKQWLSFAGVIGLPDLLQEHNDDSPGDHNTTQNNISSITNLKCHRWYQCLVYSNKKETGQQWHRLKSLAKITSFENIWKYLFDQWEGGRTFASCYIKCKVALQNVKNPLKTSYKQPNMILAVCWFGSAFLFLKLDDLMVFV